MYDPQRWNRYAYVRSNPLRYIDPNGLDLYVYYSFAADLTEEQKKFLRSRMAEIQKAVSEKFEKAGAGPVFFKDASTLTKKQIDQIGYGWHHGNALLTFANTTSLNSNGKRVPFSGFGGTAGSAFDFDPRSSVFLGNFLPGAKDDAARLLRTSEITAHELGHGQQFDAVYGTGERLMDLLGRSTNLMLEMQSPPTIKKWFDTSNAHNKKAIEELRRIKSDPIEKVK